MKTSSPRSRITIGLSSCGIAAGAEAVREAFRDALREKRIAADTGITGCMGMCHREVIVEVTDPDGRSHLYGDMTPARVTRVIDQHLVHHKPVREWLIADEGTSLATLPYFRKQTRIVLHNCGMIDPEEISSYTARGGYDALARVLRDDTPEDVIDTISRAGLRGRGGAGFPTGKKWALTRKSPAMPKYLICNGDEGDPGAFMDRSVLEGDPHAVIEGMAIAAYAIGATHGYIYVRAEYPLAVTRLARAITQANDRGFLGRDILGCGFDFSLVLMEGAGAFVCGEETALIKSIQGERGMPRLRPPYPAVSGLRGKPTCINNVETLANVPWIITHGAEAYASIGTAGSRGTKVFALAGDIARGGLVEVPMGITIREIVEDIGGGSASSIPLKAVQMGGPSGGCLPASLFDTPIDYESLQEKGAIMGSGGMVVLDEASCMVDISKYFLSFTREESCGKCTFCRIGTMRMLEILEGITAGHGRMEDLETLEELAEKVQNASLCGLGQTAPNPVLTTLRYFRDEYLAHIREKRCPAGKCKALITYSVMPERCTGCTACARVCPVAAIKGVTKEAHHIDAEKCTRCGLCRKVCRFDAILVE